VKGLGNVIFWGCLIAALALFGFGVMWAAISRFDPVISYITVCISGAIVALGWAIRYMLHG